MNDCIEWQAYRQKGGYGVQRFKGKTMLAHRVAWIKANGEIPEGLCVLHRCDNPPCCNPAHLFLGTLTDNVMDCKSKGRISRATRNQGSAHGKSVVTEQTAVILKMVRGLVPLKKLAASLGMSKQGIWDIQVGRNWKHVTAQTRYVF